MVWCCFLFGHFFQVGLMSFTVWLMSMQQFCEHAGVLAVTGSHDEGQIQPRNYSSLSEQGKCLSVWNCIVYNLLGCSPSCLVTSPAGTQKTTLAHQLHILGRLLLLGALESVSKALLTLVSFVLSMVLQGRKNFSLGRTSRGNRSCVSAQKLWTILLIWNRMLSSIPQILITSEGRVVAKDLNKELSSLDVLWSAVEFPDTEQLSCTLPAGPVPQVLGLHSLAWSWQAFCGSYPDSDSLRGKSVAAPIIWEWFQGSIC